VIKILYYIDLSLSLLFLSINALGAIIYVTMPGYPNFQVRNNVATTGDIMLVADGIYTDPRNNNIDSRGGVTIKSTNGPESTIIDCKNDRSGKTEDDLTAIINYLINYVEVSGCLFIRNNKEHSAEEALAHMQRKYEHFKDEIKKPEDFIRLAASKSLMSGKSYFVRTKEGRKIKSETWLKAALEEYRTNCRRQKID
jgi:hypothetical protein